MAKSGRLESLDNLRGLAILLVVAFHVSLSFPLPGFLQSVLQLGNVGVQLFFLISALTMCHMWEQRRGEVNPVGSFYLRRFLRIAPPFWVALVFYTVVTFAKTGTLGDIGPWDLGLTALFLHGFSVHAINLVVPGGWSIAVEMSFYVVFPLLVTRFRTVLGRVVLAFVLYLLCVAATVAVKPFLAGGDGELFLYYSLLTQLPIFAVGMALYGVLLAKEKPEWLIVGLIAALWLAVAFVGKELGFPARPFFWVEVFLLGGLMSLVLLRDWHWSPLGWIGRWSYSMYLFHFAIIEFVTIPLVRPWVDGPLGFAVGLIVSVAATSAVAWASGHTLENWSTAAARGLISRIRAPRAILTVNSKSE